MNILCYYREASFRLILSDQHSMSTQCDGVENLGEGVEFGMRTSDTAQWIPLQVSFFETNKNPNSLPFRPFRGYNVSTDQTITGTMNVFVPICGELILNASEIQFRWMATTKVVNSADTWALGNVHAVLVQKDRNITLFEDSFGRNKLK